MATKSDDFWKIVWLGPVCLHHEGPFFDKQTALVSFFPAMVLMPGYKSFHGQSKIPMTLGKKHKDENS